MEETVQQLNSKKIERVIQEYKNDGRTDTTAHEVSLRVNLLPAQVAGLLKYSEKVKYDRTREVWMIV
jgi:hypothetical protein